VQNARNGPRCRTSAPFMRNRSMFQQRNTRQADPRDAAERYKAGDGVQSMEQYGAHCSLYVPVALGNRLPNVQPRVGTGEVECWRANPSNALPLTVTTMGW